MQSRKTMEMETNLMKTNVSLFVDIVKDKKWGKIIYIIKSSIKKLKTKLLFKVITFEIFEAKIRNSKRYLLKFFQKKINEIFNIFLMKIRYLNCDFFREETIRIRNIKKKTSFFSCFLKENEQTLGKIFFSTIFKNVRKNFLKINEIFIEYFSFQKLSYNYTFNNFLNFFNLDKYQMKLLTFPNLFMPCVRNNNFIKISFAKISIYFLYSFEKPKKLFSELRFFYFRALIVKNKFFFFSFFFAKKNFYTLFKVTKKIYEYFFFLCQLNIKPLSFLKYYNLFEEVGIRKKFVYNSLFNKVLNHITILLFKEILYFKLSFFKLIFSNFLPFLRRIFLKIQKKKESKFSRFSKKNKEIKKFLKFSLPEIIYKNFDVFFLFNFILNFSKKKKNFLLKSFSKAKNFFIIRSLFKFFFSKKSKFINLKITIEKKTNKLEMGIKMNRFINGFYFPLNILKIKGKKSIIRIPLRFEYNFFEIIWGAKQMNIPSQEIIFYPSSLIDNLYFQISLSQEMLLWENFMKFHENYTFKKNSKSLLFIDTFKNILFLKNFEKKKSFRNFFLKEIYWSLCSPKILFFDIQILSLLKSGEKIIKILIKIYLIFFIFLKKTIKKRIFKFDFLIFLKIILLKMSFFYAFHYKFRDVS